MKVIIFPVLISFIIILSVGCSNNAEDLVEEQDYEEKTVKIVYVEWSSEIASSHVVKAAIEDRLGYNCELLPVNLIAAWEAIAAGDQDGMVAAWLPSVHRSYYESFGDKVIDLGPNLKDTKIGLVVPSYVNIESIEDLKKYQEKFNYSIIGIDPEAGIMEITSKAINEYELNDFELISGSDATMTTTLGNAIAQKDWIVITGWTPHWKFAKWDLKYLEDPKRIYGGNENINTIVRQGLKEDMPEIYSFLDRFYWTPDDMAQVMLWIEDDGLDPLEAGRKWIEANEEKVNKWVSN